MAKIKWSVPAEIDVITIDDFYRGDNPDIADRTSTDIVSSARFLAQHPRIGATVEGTSYRKWRVSKSPYILLYRPILNGVEILRIRHMREDWKP